MERRSALCGAGPELYGGRIKAIEDGAAGSASVLTSIGARAYALSIPGGASFGLAYVQRNVVTLGDSENGATTAYVLTAEGLKPTNLDY